jgi:hypothetical protein
VLADGITCEECYAFLGAGILIILQYGYNGDSFDIEVKGGGGAGVSAFINMKNPSISAARTLVLQKPATKYLKTSFGGLYFSYKFGGMNATLSGSGGARGSMRFGSAQSAYGAQGLLYSSSDGLSFPSVYRSQSISPSLSTSTISASSLNLGLELMAAQNFAVGYSSYLSIEFDANIAGSIEYSYGPSSFASVSVLSGNADADRTSRTLRTQNDAAANASYLNFVPGDVTVIKFEYSDFNPLESTILFYSIQKSDGNTHPIMQRNFTSSSTGSGIFETSWTVPWDFALAGEGRDNTQVVVKVSNSLFNSYKSESFATTLFTEEDGIFSAPHAFEVIAVMTPYTLRWASTLLHYFRPTQWGTGFGEEVQSSAVTFEVVAERIFLNGSVRSSIPYRNLTQGPVSNTGECVVTFPESLLDTGDRFYISVHAKGNSETSGWSKAYFTLTSEQGVRHLSNAVRAPAIKSNQPSPSLTRTSHVATVPSTRNRSLLSEVSSRNLGSCSANQASLNFKVVGGLAARDLVMLYAKFDASWLGSTSVILLPESTTCRTGPFPLTASAPTSSPLGSISMVAVELPFSGFTFEGNVF